MKQSHVARSLGDSNFVGWDKRSAVPPCCFAAIGGTALRLSHPTLACQRILPRPKQSGFTLVEIILALALVAVVLGLLSLAIDIHLRTADASRTGVKEVRLAQMVLQQMADDLRNTIPFTPAPASDAANGSSPTGGTSSSGSSPDGTQGALSLLGGFSGNSRELRVDISRLPLLDPVQAAATSAGSSQVAAPTGDVRTVSYSVV
jgi:prepilin-type N-terminal cleavage/methylation domain-containing protein